MAKKILILYTSVGLGHKTIAENIGWHLQQAGYGVKYYDVLQLQAGILAKVGTRAHQFINKKLPFVWKWLYNHADQGWFSHITLPNRIKVASRNYHHVKKVVDEFSPDLIITTQTTASAIVHYLKQQNLYPGLFAIAFSDYHLHRYWLYQDVDFYLANIQEQKQQMVEMGLPEEKIFVLGMTLQPRPEVNTAAVRQKLDIKPGEHVVLAASGSLGTGLSASWFIKLAGAIKQLPKVRLIIVCGKNEQLKEVLKQKITDNQTVIQGYYSPLAELYAISNIFLTKPGGLTVAETLQWHLPLLIIHWLPGQEEINYRYLLGKHLVMSRPPTVEPSALLPLIKEELNHQTFRNSLISNAEALKLIQASHEGQALVEAIRNRFHDV